MTHITEEEAAKMPCPIARTFGDGKSHTCDGAGCILWRWKPRLASDPLFMSAVKREMASQAQDAAESTGKPAKDSMTYHKSAVAAVARDPEAHGVVNTHGYCGLGGPVT